MSTMHILLDPKIPSRNETELVHSFRDYMISQDRPIRHLVKRIIYANSMGGKLRDSTKPAGTGFYLGPSGVGKTRLVEVFAYLMFGHFEAFTKIDCSELQHSHDISRLIGAPPGYLGFNIEPWLTQNRIDHWGFMTRVDDETVAELSDLKLTLDEAEQVKKSLLLEFRKNEDNKDKDSRLKNREIKSNFKKISKICLKLSNEYKKLANSHNYKPGAYPAILLFDEIEKGHPALFQLLLQVHDKARLTVNSSTRDGNKIVSFHNTFIFYTSNIGQEEIRKLVSGRSIGFATKNKPANLEGDIYRRALKKMESLFSTEFIGRIGKENIIVFSPLTREDLYEELERIRIPDFLKRIRERSITVHISDSVKEYIVDEARDLHNLPLGLRALKNVFVKRIEEAISSLASKEEDEGGIISGDIVTIDIKDSVDNSRELEFFVSSRITDQDKEEIKIISENNVRKDTAFPGPPISTFKMLNKL